MLSAKQEETARQFLLRDFGDLVSRDAQNDGYEDPRAILEEVVLLYEVGA